jgi:hypothetical protein
LLPMLDGNRSNQGERHQTTNPRRTQASMMCCLEVAPKYWPRLQPVVFVE